MLLMKNAIGQTAREIVQRADENMRGKTSQATILIQIVRPTWRRELKIRTCMKGNDLATIYIESPVKEKGIVFLKRKREVWNWIPALEKIIKLPPSMMNHAWMGTDFTNDDLVKESSVVHDYEHYLMGDTVVLNRACYLLKLLPKPDAAVVWGKLILCIDKKDFLELFVRFYDEDGNLTQVMLADEIRQMDDRIIPTRFEMIPMEKPNQKTVMIYQSIRYDQPMEDRQFTLEYIKNMRY